MLPNYLVKRLIAHCIIYQHPITDVLEALWYSTLIDQFSSIHLAKYVHNEPYWTNKHNINSFISNFFLK